MANAAIGLGMWLVVDVQTTVEGGSVKWPVHPTLRPCVCSFTRSLFVVNMQSGGKARCQCVAKGPERRAHLKDRLHKRADFPHPLLLLLLHHHPFAISCPLTPLAVQQAEEEGIYKSPQPPPSTTILSTSPFVGGRGEARLEVVYSRSSV